MLSYCLSSITNNSYWPPNIEMNRIFANHKIIIKRRQEIHKHGFKEIKEVLMTAGWSRTAECWCNSTDKGEGDWWGKADNTEYVQMKTDKGLPLPKASTNSWTVASISWKEKSVCVWNSYTRLWAGRAIGKQICCSASAVCPSM